MGVILLYYKKIITSRMYRDWDTLYRNEKYIFLSPSNIGYTLNNVAMDCWRYLTVWTSKFQSLKIIACMWICDWFADKTFVSKCLINFEIIFLNSSFCLFDSKIISIKDRYPILLAKIFFTFWKKLSFISLSNVARNHNFLYYKSKYINIKNL